MRLAIPMLLLATHLAHADSPAPPAAPDAGPSVASPDAPLAPASPPSSPAPAAPASPTPDATPSADSTAPASASASDRTPIEPWPFAPAEHEVPPPPPRVSPAPFAVDVSAGVGTASIGFVGTGTGYYDYGEGGVVQTLNLDLGIRVNARWMVGLHAGAGSRTTFVDGWSDYMGTEERRQGIRTIQYGVTAQFAVRPNVWLSPWLGVQDSMRRAECYLRDQSAVNGNPSTMPCVAESNPWDYHRDLQPAVGITAGFDALEYGGNRLSVVAALVLSSITPIDSAPDASASYSSVSLGLAYRFWR